MTALKSAAFGLVIVILYGLGSANPASAHGLTATSHAQTAGTHAAI